MLEAVAQILTARGSARRTFALLILSGTPDDPVLGVHTYRRTVSAGDFVSIEGTAANSRIGPVSEQSRDVGLRALGWWISRYCFPSWMPSCPRRPRIPESPAGRIQCFWGLQLLRRCTPTRTTPSRSSMRALSNCFATDSLVASLGQHSNCGRSRRRSAALWRLWWCRACECCIASSPRDSERKSLNSDIPPATRTYSRTEAFREVLQHVFSEQRMRDVARDSLDIVVNATELRTGSAFRFGSRQSGCWPFGTIAAEDAFVADAVAASAAYPVFLPALDRRYRFNERRELRQRPTRVLLTDGGVFENLGVGPMEARQERGD